VTFPRGSNTIPLAYNVGAAYITSQTPYADACYRWLSTVAQHPELFSEMPARRSFANSQTLIAAHGKIASDFYVSLFEMLDNPSAVFIPVGLNSGNGSIGASIPNIWFNQALDAYVLEDGTLDILLADTQARIDEYSECIAGIPPFNESLGYDDGQWGEYSKQFTDCAISVDPSLASHFRS